MKQLTGTAQVEVDATRERCYALLADIVSYPRWHPDIVRDVSVLTTHDDGLPTTARATLHVARGPLVRNLELTLAVERRPPGAISLIRLPNEPTDPEQLRVDWRLTGDGRRTRIALELAANLSLPKVLPLGGIGDALAQGFVAAAARGISRSP
jgi:hypothetical protein